MPNDLIKKLMKQFKVEQPKVEKAIAIGQNTSQKPETVLHQMMAGSFAGQKPQQYQRRSKRRFNETNVTDAQ